MLQEQNGESQEFGDHLMVFIIHCAKAQEGIWKIGPKLPDIQYQIGLKWRTEPNKNPAFPPQYEINIICNSNKCQVYANSIKHLPIRGRNGNKKKIHSMITRRYILHCDYAQLQCKILILYKRLFCVYSYCAQSELFVQIYSVYKYCA